MIVLLFKRSDVPIAQFLDGTTDVTRTLHFGTPTEQEKHSFTRVPQGHIAINTAVFPNRTTGYIIESWACRALWKDGLGKVVMLFIARSHWSCLDYRSLYSYRFSYLAKPGSRHGTDSWYSSFVWLDYHSSTLSGHGIGSFINVHEGRYFHHFTIFPVLTELVYGLSVTILKAGMYDCFERAWLLRRR